MALDLIITEFVQRGVSGLRDDMRAIGANADTTEGKMERLSRSGDRMLALGAGTAGALAMIGGASLKAAGEMESTRAGFATLLGGSEAAQAKIAELQTFARDSPFDFKQSAKSAQQLLAMGFAGDELIPTMKNVGNAVAAAGGDTETFQGVLMALGQIRTKGKISQEELLQMAERGIPVFQILEKQLGLTKDQVANIGEQGISAEKGIGALLKGMSEVGGGSGMADQMATLPGMMSTLGDSFEQLKTTVGEVFSADAKEFVTGLTGALDSAKAFVEQNPGLVKTAGTIAAGGAAALIAGGAYLKVKTAVGGLGQMMDDVSGKTKGAAAAKKALELATLGDLKAERDKTGVAKAEGGALAQVGKDALESAKGKKGLQGATNALKESSKAAALGLASQALATGDLGAVAQDATGQLNDLAQSKVGELIEDPKGTLTAWRDGLKGLPAQAKTARDSLKALMAQPLKIGGAGFSQMSAFGAGGAPVGTGAALGSAALGAAAGYGVSDDLKSLGASDIEANLAGIGVGAAAAAAAMFIPGAAIPIAIATGFRYAFNELVNVPMERAAEAGTGADNAEVMGEEMQGRLTAAQKSGDREAIAEIYSEMSSKAALAGDETSAQSYAKTAAGQRKSAKKEGDATTSEFWDKQRKTQADFEARNPPGAGPKSGGDSGLVSNAPLPITSKRENNGQITLSMSPFTIPLSQADRMASDDVAAGYG